MGHAIECRVNAEHPATFRPSPGRIDLLSSAGRPWRARRFGRLPGLLIPPNYDSLDRQAHRPWAHPQRVPDAASPRARRIRRRRASTPPCRCSARSCATAISRTGITTSTGSSTSSRIRRGSRPDKRIFEKCRRRCFQKACGLLDLSHPLRGKRLDRAGRPTFPLSSITRACRKPASPEGGDWNASKAGRHPTNS